MLASPSTIPNGEWKREGEKTSAAVTTKASHSILESMPEMKAALKSTSSCTSSASRKWRGNDWGEDLHDLRAQVRKFEVRIFIVREAGVRRRGLVGGVGGGGGGGAG